MLPKELAWVDYLKSAARNGRGVITGIGDDCAVVRLGKTNYLLKSDLFIEGIHFQRKDMTLGDIGRRAVARVLSDFAACAGLPLYIGISAGLPPTFTRKQAQAIVAGALSLSRQYGFSLVGGDTARAEQLFLDVWGVGSVEKPVLRSGAKIGDSILLTGPLGARKFNAPFKPRLAESQYLVRHFKINAMIDVSDGLILDLYRLLRASRKGALLYQERLPLIHGKKDLYRGEDYELLFTVDRGEKNLPQLMKKFHSIGTITSPAQGFQMQKGTTIRPVKVRGYSHF